MEAIPTIKALIELKSTQLVLDAVKGELKALRAIVINKPASYLFDVALDLKKHSAKLLELASQGKSTSSAVAFSATPRAPTPLPTLGGVKFEDLYNASPPRQRVPGIPNISPSHLPLNADPNKGTQTSKNGEKNTGERDGGGVAADNTAGVPSSSEITKVVPAPGSKNSSSQQTERVLRSNNLAAEHPTQVKMNTLDSALGCKGSFRSMKNKADGSAASNMPAPNGARDDDAGVPLEVVDTSKESVRWSRESRTREFNTRHAPAEVNDVKEEIHVDLTSDSELDLEDLEEDLPNVTNIFAASVPSGKRPFSPAPVDRERQAKKFKGGLSVQNEKAVLLVYDIEDEDDEGNELEGQAVSIEVPEKLLRQNSQTIHALLRKKEKGKGSFDPEDKTCWIPKVSRTKLALEYATLYMLPFLEYITSNKHQEAKELQVCSAGIQFDLFHHWWSWVKLRPGKNFREITNPWRKDRILMMAAVLGASPEYITDVQNYKVRAKSHSTEEAGMAWINKHHPRWLKHKDPEMYKLLKANGKLWKKGE
ncbi:hypothetical protein BKA61DRAFT_683290 [Leptodontidium sp. MPI-SDFR-AT-0119]|nr:hypothetical protein BKA61DRAFT_683290 [Leptodontidium sp. MPI-SDFR-AT-0119]